jgi:hypothetical protein
LLGWANFTVASNAIATLGATYLSAGGAGAAPSQTTHDFTSPLAIDLTWQWSEANVGDTGQVLGAAIWIDG